MECEFKDFLLSSKEGANPIFAKFWKKLSEIEIKGPLVAWWGVPLDLALKWS